MFQLCYSSKTTSLDHTILNDLRDILGEARDFNVRHNIHGVLYFSDEYFFQCLEGDEAIIDALFQNILKDRRHQDVKLYKTKKIETAHFNQWSMKYVNRKSHLHHYFKQKGLDGLSLIKLTDDELPHLLKLLYEIDQDSL